SVIPIFSLMHHIYTFFFFSSRRRHTRSKRDWSSDVCSSDLSIIKRQVREDGQEAITHFTVLERTENKSKVKINLETGRTHQIRVHFATMGHPLVGDDL